MTAPRAGPTVTSHIPVPPRERILAVARELFYRRGIHAVGVDAIAEAAGTNKMTLYRHFSSKDDLVAACLRELVAEHNAAWDAVAAAHPGDPLGELTAWLKHIGEWFVRESGRGCALANAAVELPDPDHPARRVVREHKSAIRERLVRLCRDAGLHDPEAVASQVFLVCEGARVAAQSLGSDEPLTRLPALLKDLVEERTPSAAASRRKRHRGLRPATRPQR
jgi:AcrR family transcriptional regulator